MAMTQLTIVHTPIAGFLRMAFKVPDHFSMYLFFSLQTALNIYDVLGAGDAVMEKTQFLLFICSHSIINTVKR